MPSSSWDSNVSFQPNSFVEGFDTKSIFAIADFLKALKINEQYDMASKLYTNWEEKRLDFQ